MKFWKYLGLRVLTWALTILIGVTFIFFIPRMFPSDPVESMIGQMQARSGDMDPAAKEAHWPRRRPRSEPRVPSP